MNIYLNILVNIIFVAALAPNAPKPSDSVAPTIAVKHSPRARIAFLLHKGAYWSIGPTISKVRTAQDSSAPLFVRYETDPRRISPAQLKAKVGFVLEIGKVAPDGFRAETQPSELVAWMRVEDSPSALARHYTTLAKWARENGYQPTGPVIERHPPVHAGTPHVEVQLVVRKEEPRASSTPRAIDTYATIPPERSQPTENTKPPTDRAATATPRNPAPLPKRATKALTTQAQSEQAAAQDYDQLAIRLIPEREDWSQEQAVTLGPTIMRVRAIAQIAKTRYGPDASRITDLSNSLTNRYTQVFGAGLASALKPPEKRRKRTRRIGDPDDPLAQLDRIFSQMLTDRIDAAEVETTLLRVLTRTVNPRPNAYGPKLP